MEELAKLTGELFDAKRDEDEAKKKRVEIEEQIAALVPTADTGSKTVDAGNGVKVTVKRGLGYKADLAAIRGLDIPEEVMPIKLIPASYAFDAKIYEDVCRNHPDVARKLADCVTTTPRKTGVTLKLA